MCLDTIISIWIEDKRFVQFLKIRSFHPLPSRYELSLLSSINKYILLREESKSKVLERILGLTKPACPKKVQKVWNIPFSSNFFPQKSKPYYSLKACLSSQCYRALRAHSLSPSLSGCRSKYLDSWICSFGVQELMNLVRTSRRPPKGKLSRCSKPMENNMNTN